MQKRIRIILLTILIAASLFFILDKTFLPGLSATFSPDDTFKILGSVIKLIKDDYVEEPDPSQTMEGAFRGMVDSLDILSSYLDKEGVAKYLQRKEPGLKGIGVVLYKGNGPFPIVIGVKEKSPAEKNGIKVGELIGTLDGQSTLMMSMLEANLYLKSKEVKSVNLKILGSNKDRDVSIKRALLYKEPFSYSSAKDTSGILKIHHLFPPCVDKIKEKILPQLKPQKKPLILDMRDCHEGEIGEAQQLINLFLHAEKIGYFEKKGGITTDLSCHGKAELSKLPLVIWTNQATIGPAEITAGVLKEYKKAKIIGLQTLGLAARQNFFAFEDGSGLVLTSEVFHLDSKKKLWREGITPDVKIEGKDHSSSIYIEKTQKLLPEI